MEMFLTIILFIIVFFWLMSRLLPLLITWWLKRKLGKFAGNPGFAEDGHKTEEGEVFVEQIKKQEKVVDKSVGEYVDFEEEKNKE